MLSLSLKNHDLNSSRDPAGICERLVEKIVSEEEALVKVLQTLGRHGGAQEGIFQYKRTAAGVFIDSTVGVANLNPAQVTLTAAEWSRILAAIEAAPQGSFRLTGQAPFQQPPNQSLYELLTQAVPDPAGGWNWNDSWRSYVCAVLEHEGSIDLYHGVLGQGHSALLPSARHPLTSRRPAHWSLGYLLNTFRQRGQRENLDAPSPPITPPRTAPGIVPAIAPSGPNAIPTPDP